MFPGAIVKLQITVKQSNINDYPQKHEGFSVKPSKKSVSNELNLKFDALCLENF